MAGCVEVEIVVRLKARSNLDEKLMLEVNPFNICLSQNFYCSIRLAIP